MTAFSSNKIQTLLVGLFTCLTIWGIFCFYYGKNDLNSTWKFFFLDSLCQFCSKRGVFCWLSQEMELLSNSMTSSALDYFSYMWSRCVTNSGWNLMEKEKDLWEVAMAALQNSCMCACLSLFPKTSIIRSAWVRIHSSQSSNPSFSLS